MNLKIYEILQFQMQTLVWKTLPLAGRFCQNLQNEIFKVANFVETCPNDFIIWGEALELDGKLF